MGIISFLFLSVLHSLFETALSLPGAVGLNIATRADCLPEDIVAYLAELSQRTVLTVELGLQSCHDRTAMLINRGHTWAQFCQGYEALQRASRDIRICVHLIFGLPGESEDDMLETVRRVAQLHPHQVKIHLLHVLKGTALANMYERGDYQPMTRQAYIETVAKALMLLPPDTVIGRLTGDGMASSTIHAPLCPETLLSRAKSSPIAISSTVISPTGNKLPYSVLHTEHFALTNIVAVPPECSLLSFTEPQSHSYQ